MSAAFHIVPVRTADDLALHDEIMPEGGYGFAGPHHEVYLGDPRKTPAEKLRTVIRQPVRKL